MAAAERYFPPDHPAARGHFPGNPVIPGAVVLGEALGAVEAGSGVSLARCRVNSAKFLAPVRPGDRIAIEYTRTGGTIRFSCKVGERAVLKGDLRCEATPAAG